MPTIRQIREDINDTLTFYDVADVMSTIASLAYAKISKLYEANFLELSKSIADINEFLEDKLFTQDSNPFLTGDTRKVAILIGSNIGFCGKFNNVIKENFAKIIGKLSDYDYVFLIGRQLFALHETAEKMPFPVAKVLSWENLIQIKDNSIADIVDILDKGNSNFEISVLTNTYDIITKKAKKDKDGKNVPWLYKFHYVKNIDLKNSDLIKKEGYYQTLADVILEPEPDTFMRNFLNYYFRNTLLNLLVQSEIVENFERMNSMNQAKDEIEIILKVLRRKLQKMRQAKITNELLEVIAGKKN
jgi:F-type H+-transporting ATPase subunit gamma